MMVLGEWDEGVGKVWCEGVGRVGRGWESGVMVSEVKGESLYVVTSFVIPTHLPSER